jgi:hypothetical protein
MYKYFFAIATFICFSTGSIAQKEPKGFTYEELDAYSKKISQFQLNNSGFTTVENGNNFTLTFPEQNFELFYYDKKASASYFINGSLLLIEDIDLRRVSHVQMTDNSIIVYFPSEELKVQVYGTEYMDFPTDLFEIYTTEGDVKQAFKTLYDLINEFKIHEGTTTAYEAKQHWDDFHSLGAYKYFVKYPDGLLSLDGQHMKKMHDDKVAFVRSFFKRHDFPVRNETSIAQLSYKIDGVYEVMSYREKYTNYGDLPYKAMAKKPGPYPVTIQSKVVYRDPNRYDDYSTDNLITSYTYCLINTTDYELAKKKFDELQAEFTNNLGPELVQKQENSKNAFWVSFLTESSIGKDLMNHGYNFSSVHIGLYSYVHRKVTYYYISIYA